MQFCVETRNCAVGTSPKVGDENSLKCLDRIKVQRDDFLNWTMKIQIDLNFRGALCDAGIQCVMLFSDYVLRKFNVILI